VNESASALYGYCREELLRMKNSDLSAEPDKTMKAMADKSTAIPVRYHRKKDGTVFPVEIAASHMTWKGRQVHIAAIRDITQRIKADAALRESLERFELANRAMFNIIWDWNLKAGTLWWNENFKMLFGYREEEIEPGIESWTSRIHPEDHDRVKKGIYAAIEQKKHSWYDQYRFRKSDGTYVNIVDRGYFSFNEQGEPVRMIGAMEDMTARIQLEEERERILNMSYDLICVAGMDGYFKYLNPAWERVLGYSREELLSRPFLDFIHPDDHRRNDAEVASLAEGNLTVDFENRYIHRNGSVRIINWRAVPLLEQKLMYCIGRDVTEKREAEAALKETEQRYRLIVENMDDAMLLMVPDGSILSVNPAGCRIFGRSEEEIIRLGRNGIIDSTDPRLAAGLKERAETGMFRGVLTGIRANGEKFPIEVSSTVFKDSQGSFRTAMIISDISERIRAEKAIMESERFAVGTVNALSANIAILDDSGVIISANNSWRHFARDNDADPSRVSEGINYLAVCDSAFGEGSEGAAEFAEGIRAVMRSELESYSHEYPCHSPSVRRWFSGRVTRFAGEGPIRVVVAHMDITERKLAEEAIRASLIEKEALLKEIHHRVKNNLQVISSMLELHSANIKKETNIQAAMIDMQNRIRSMALVHEMLYQTENLSRVDFKTYIEGIIAYLTTSIMMIGDKIRIASDVRSITLGIDDAIPCGLILNELITNAIKHAFPGGRKGVITVSMKENEDGFLCLTVKDDGIGMPDGVRADAVETLGLRLVRLLGKQLGGVMSFSNSKGSEVSLKFRRH
jgi:PAS domain S-box-containing protein